MKNTPVNRPENLRIFSGLIRSLSDMGGKLFYYADEKPLGTAKQTSFNSELGAQRERDAMQETLNRIARHADYHECNVQVMIDTVNENQRRDRVAKMYQHIFDRSSSFREMRWIIEPPMHIDSILSSTIQFADWVAAYLSRAIDRQLIEDSTFMWVGEHPSHFDVAGSFTHESKLHLYHKDVQDLNHSEVVYSEWPLWDHADNAVSVGSRVGPAVFRMIHSAAVRANHNR